MTSPPYNPVTPAIVEALRAIVGDAHVIYADAERLEPYSHDEIHDARYAHKPECVVRPATGRRDRLIVKLANRERFP